MLAELGIGEIEALTHRLFHLGTMSRVEGMQFGHS